MDDWVIGLIFGLFLGSWMVLVWRIRQLRRDVRALQKEMVILGDAVSRPGGWIGLTNS